ncbi:hypothetical protein ACE1B6_09795 [Aerosakkonemataceae cyanobacterium BLCC-F154]|uniref:Uncharacterized protein n=1 Tax=Floridaenema fluviatile BLCC-F154 TaxID=3153640 RepID=A0ABV4Y9S4_9CYAN
MATAIATHKQNVTKALDRVISIDEKRRLMLIEVLREESGRELEAQARFSNGEVEFDWKEHNAQFRIDYADASLKELLEYARKLYGLADIDAVRERRAKHKAQIRARLERN